MECEHLCNTTSRYDHGEKELSFLLVCARCDTEELVQRMHYEPRFSRHAGSSAPPFGGARTRAALPA